MGRGCLPACGSLLCAAVNRGGGRPRVGVAGVHGAPCHHVGVEPVRRL